MRQFDGVVVIRCFVWYCHFFGSFLVMEVNVGTNCHWSSIFSAFSDTLDVGDIGIGTVSFDKEGFESNVSTISVDVSSDTKPSIIKSDCSIAERRAAKCGFNVSQFDKAQTGTFFSPDVRSPYVTIPAGSSPATLLESPVTLPYAQVTNKPKF